jgi:hypothetical protein
VHGIGLADSNYVNQSRTFRLYGTQVWGIKDFATYAVFTPAWKHYVIPVGRYYKGDMLYLIFANDHDVPDPTGEGYFSSVRVYERDDPEILNFRDYVIESYGGDEDEGYGGVGHGGATLHLVGNAWKKISFPYTVTGNTVLEFDFRSEAQGEVHAIGLTDSTDLDEPRTFRLYGTEAWGISDFATYDALAPAWEHYVIPLGRYYSGAMSFLIFANDHDVPDPTGEGYFSNVKVFERR